MQKTHAERCNKREEGMKQEKKVWKSLGSERLVFDAGERQDTSCDA